MFVLGVVFCILILIQLFSINTFATRAYDFENFTEDDAIMFVREHNIERPEQMLDSEKYKSFTLNIPFQLQE